MSKHKTHSPNGKSPYRPSIHALAWLAVLVTVPLLFSGAEVTTRKVGMAVPDWPTTFGENMLTFDMSNSPLGVVIEHRHRLFGMTLGFLTLIVAAWFLIAAPSRWIKSLAALTPPLVLAQGILGGSRVLQNSTLLAAIHGLGGQCVFTALVALAALSSRSWAEGRAAPASRALMPLCTAAPLCVALQAMLGSRLRHFGVGLEWHAAMAVVVAAYITFLSIRVLRARPSLDPLRPAATTMLASVACQLALGGLAWWMLQPFDGIARPVNDVQNLVRNLHLINGAILLAATTVLALRAARHTHAAATPASPANHRIGAEPRTLTEAIV
jgi:cytochrome c oxidase assembly protein subunit 15